MIVAAMIVAATIVEVEDLTEVRVIGLFPYNWHVLRKFFKGLYKQENGGIIGFRREKVSSEKKFEVGTLL